MAQYFLDENLSGADKLIEKLENKDKRAFIVKNNYPAGTCEIRIPYYYCDEEELAASNRELTMDERRMVADAYRWEREKFKARLNTYLKRYGVSKLHIWSYWADA